MQEVEMRNELHQIGLLLAFSALMIGLAQPIAALAAAESSITNVTQTLGSTQYYPCAGEFIQLSGDYHALFHVTFDSTGGTHVLGQYNSKGVSGVGMQSGTTFRAVDGERRSTNIFGAPGFESTYIDRFRLIGRGTATNLLVTVTTHATYTPSQGFTVQITNMSSECN
jgi:hypothetical protein